MHKRWRIVGLFIFSLLIVALVTRNGDIAWMMLPFLIYLGVGIVQVPTVESIHLNAERKVTEHRADGITLIEVSVTIENQGARPVYLLIFDTVQEGTEIVDGELSRRVDLRSGDRTELRYTFTAKRGNFTWKSVQLMVSDVLGLTVTNMSLPASARTQIRPPIKKFPSISFRPHSTLHSPGSIPARMGGNGTDFFGIREYHTGDPMRLLDWRLTARHPRKFFTKEFEQEEIAEIGLILDARYEADLCVGNESIFESSVSAAASLSQMFLHQGHRVSLLAFGGSISCVFPGYGKLQLQRIMNCLTKVKVSTESFVSALNYLPIRMFPSRALIIVISSITPTDKSLFLRLRAFGYQVLLISPNPLDLAYPMLPQDIVKDLAIRTAHLERVLRLRDIAQLHIPVIDWSINKPLFPLVRNALTRSRGQRE